MTANKFNNASDAVSAGADQLVVEFKALMADAEALIQGN
jgi:hypothetical protein